MPQLGQPQPLGSDTGDGYELVVIGPQTLRFWSLDQPGTLTIGRQSDCHIKLDAETLSRHHARIHVAAGSQFHIEDLGSVNGVLVNSVRIAPHIRTPVKPGVVFELGGMTALIRPRSKNRPARQAVSTPPREDAPPPPPRAWVVSKEMLNGTDPLLKNIANSSITVLITGETGVGKEYLADRLHGWSPRSRRPFIKLNCAGFPDSLIESELFGHEQGSFTNAYKLKRGQFELADEGCVFLDEVGELSPAAQAKLLRFLESREFMRVGGEKSLRANVRIIAATNRKLYGPDAFHGFREDLYFRLAVATLWLPPLRQRRDEILPLAEHFLTRFCLDEKRAAPRFSKAACTALMAHSWPGNIRELRNAIEQAVVLCSGETIEPAHLQLEAAEAGGEPNTTVVMTLPKEPPIVTAPPVVAPLEFRSRPQRPDRAALEQLLASHGGNQTQAAKAAGVARGTFIKWMEEENLIRPRKREAS